MSKLICPSEIDTLAKLRKWVDDYGPDIILIGKDSKLLDIRQFGDREWERYRGIPVKYLESFPSPLSELTMGLEE